MNETTDILKWRKKLLSSENKRQLDLQLIGTSFDLQQWEILYLIGAEIFQLGSEEKFRFEDLLFVISNITGL